MIMSMISSLASHRDIAAGAPAHAVGPTLRRCLAALVAARERKAAIQVLRRLEDLIPHATGAARADLVALAERVRAACGAPTERDGCGQTHGRRS
jgi:hypothetical protein